MILLKNQKGPFLTAAITRKKKSWVCILFSCEHFNNNIASQMSCWLIFVYPVANEMIILSTLTGVHDSKACTPVKVDKSLSLNFSSVH